VEAPPKLWACGSHLGWAFSVFEPCHVCQSQLGGDNQGLVEEEEEEGASSGQPAHRLPEVPHNQGGHHHTLRTLVLHTPHILAPRTLHIHRTLVPRSQAAQAPHSRAAQVPHIQAGRLGELPQSRLLLPQSSPGVVPARCSPHCSLGTLQRPKRTWDGSSRIQYSTLRSLDIPPCGQFRIRLP